MNHWPQLSTPLDGAKLRVISHGGGVQTSTLCLMAARGDIGPMPDMAFFADTGGEPARVYEYLDWIRGQVPFPIHLLKRPGPSLGDLAIGVADGSTPMKGSPVPPWFLTTPKGRAMLPKQCSGQYKRDVVVAAIRDQLGLKPKQRGPKHPEVEVWIGISTDEMVRVASSRQNYIHNRHPLVELNMSRNQCIKWLQDRQMPVPPKSACVYCPFRRNDGWRHMRDTAPEDFAEAVRIDNAIRRGNPDHDGQAFVHRSCVPLERANLEDHHIDQRSFEFAADCEACGL
jgi:hypothetical protein